MVITKENQFKLIRQFGRVERVQTQAGLSFKIPFVESVDTIPKQGRQNDDYGGGG